MPATKIIKRRRGVPWTLAELKQLGKTPDAVLARRARRTIKEVAAMREGRRIGLPTPPRRWSAREIKLLGTLPDPQLAQRLRRNVNAVLSVTKLRHRLRILAWRK